MKKQNNIVDDDIDQWIGNSIEALRAECDAEESAIDQATIDAGYAAYEAEQYEKGAIPVFLGKCPSDFQIKTRNVHLSQLSTEKRFNLIDAQLNSVFLKLEAIEEKLSSASQQPQQPQQSSQHTPLVKTIRGKLGSDSYSNNGDTIRLYHTPENLGAAFNIRAVTNNLSKTASGDAFFRCQNFSAEAQADGSYIIEIIGITTVVLSSDLVAACKLDDSYNLNVCTYFLNSKKLGLIFNKAQ